MPIITVISDWNNKDYYLPVLKGRVYSLFSSSSDELKGVVIEPLTMSITPFDIQQGCFILKNSFKSFPIGSIHILAVNSEPSVEVPNIVVYYNGHWIISKNDGRFSHIFGSKILSEGLAKAYELPLPDEYSTYMACDQYVYAIELICRGDVASTLEECEIKTVGGVYPTIMEDKIIGKVMYIDSYGNAITNISKDTFVRWYSVWGQKHDGEPQYTIYVQGPYLNLHSIHNTYSDVPIGENIAVFNSAGWLEFAINNGNFSKVESIDVNAEVIIRFF